MRLSTFSALRRDLEQLLYILTRNLSGNIAYQQAFFEPPLNPCYISLDTPFNDGRIWEAVHGG